MQDRTRGSYLIMSSSSKPSLEYLLSSRTFFGNAATSIQVEDTSDKDCHAVSLHQAKKSATLDDLMEMISKLISKSGQGKKLNVEFIPDEGSRIYADQNFQIDHPYIFFNVVNAVPTNELKPRVRKTFNEEPEKDHSRNGIVYGQSFEAIVQFNIFGCDYLQATEVMKFLEDLLFSYTAYFMQNGIAELIFHKRLTDQNLDLFRQKSSIRSLQYYVRYERNFVTYDQGLAGAGISK